MLILPFFSAFCTAKMVYYGLGSVMKSPLPPASSYLTDEVIVAQAVDQLHNIMAATDLDECVSCKMRLQVGKMLALTRSDLVPEVFTTWCKNEGFDDTGCRMNFGYPSEEYSSLGGDFTRMVQWMDPEGLDGDLFCYYHDEKCHVLPELPEISLSQLWPPKPRLYDPPKASGESFNVLHLSDIALQADYTLAAESNCSQVVCCSPHSYNKQEPPADYEYTALFDSHFKMSFYDSSYETGHFRKGSFVDQYKDFTPVWLPSHEFGSYACNSPELLVNNTLQIIRDFHENHLNFEFALLTGDVISNGGLPHTDRYGILRAQSMAYRDISHYMCTIPFFPTFGSETNFPLGQFPLPQLDNAVSYQWQFDYLADMWHDLGWLNHHAAKQVRYSKVGYSMVTERGLKIVSLNSNVWSTSNLYSFVDTLNFDPFGTWQFLIDELIDSETNEQRVWIIASKPPSANGHPVSTKVFKKIIERFSPKVIAALFFGNALEDQFKLIYVHDVKDMDHLVNFVFVGPSVTPLNGNNPSWRYYAVDTDSFDVINSFTYYTKLNHTFINDGAEPVWEFEYSAREAYDPEQLWPMERSLDSEFWHHAGEKIRDMADINKMYSTLACRNSPFDPYYYSNFESEIPVNDSLILGNDNYCRVTSFSTIDQKQCMLTVDQDNYIEPAEPQTFIPVINPYKPPEYKLLQPVPQDPLPQEEYHYEEAESPDFDDDISVRAIRDKISAGHKKIKRELAKRLLA